MKREEKAANKGYCLINVWRDKFDTLLSNNGEELIRNNIDSKYLKFIKLDTEQKFISFKANKKLRLIKEKNGECDLCEYVLTFMHETITNNGLSCTLIDLDIIFDIYEHNNLITIRY